jgi:hypothetical protein
MRATKEEWDKPEGKTRRQQNNRERKRKRKKEFLLSSG